MQAAYSDLRNRQQWFSNTVLWAFMLNKICYFDFTRFKPHVKVTYKLINDEIVRITYLE